MEPTPHGRIPQANPFHTSSIMNGTAQVNIRLTHAEKALIASATAQSGCKGFADFIRTTVFDCAIFNR